MEYGLCFPHLQQPFLALPCSGMASAKWFARGCISRSWTTSAALPSASSSTSRSCLWA